MELETLKYVCSGDGRYLPDFVLYSTHEPCDVRRRLRVVQQSRGGLRRFAGRHRRVRAQVRHRSLQVASVLNLARVRFSQGQSPHSGIRCISATGMPEAFQLQEHASLTSAYVSAPRRRCEAMTRSTRALDAPCPTPFDPARHQFRRRAACGCWSTRPRQAVEVRTMMVVEPGRLPLCHQFPAPSFLTIQPLGIFSGRGLRIGWTRRGHDFYCFRFQQAGNISALRQRDPEKLPGPWAWQSSRRANPCG